MTLSIQVIIFSVVSFHMQGGYGCRYDSLTLYDGNSTDDFITQKKYCEYEGPDQLRTSKNVAILVFRSNFWANYPGRATDMVVRRNDMRTIVLLITHFLIGLVQW